MSDPKTEKPIDYDPVFLHSRREAIVIFLIWLACLLWSVPFCYAYGYPETFEAESFDTILGVPMWLFWGIAAPWILANVATIWFCFAFMQDDDLGVAEDELPKKSSTSSKSGSTEDVS